MSPRVLTGVAAAVVAGLLVCAAGIGAWFTGQPAAGCASITATAGPSPSPSTGMAGYDAEQVGHAGTIITVGQRLGVPPRGWVIALAVALQESGLRNLDGGPDDSAGLFQQRPSQGWGTHAQIRDPQHAAAAFYRRLLTVAGWQQLPLTDAAQQVQRSAYPQAYAKWEPDAHRLATHLTGPAAVLACSESVGGQGWIRPVAAPVGSGFRTGARPGHDGVDLSAARGTPVVAAAAGTVSRVRCNAVHAGSGAPWGCDRDGDLRLTRGCGWYLDITHPGDIVSRYCHLGARPTVSYGDLVQAGQPIGVVGSTGHSSGPHLHFEIHLGGHDAATAIDPVPFMAAHGAPL